MLSRARQFLDAGRLPTDADYALARERLAAPLFALFEAQHPRDIVHSAATARWLLSRGYSADDLIAAALLHDIGKGDQRLTDRVAFVLASKAGIARKLADARSGMAGRRAMARSLDHSETGARALREHGGSERLVDLTLRHHAPPRGDTMLALLQQADAAS
jgi:putative nucleotidyltransferase with HDIG domain